MESQRTYKTPVMAILLLIGMAALMTACSAQPPRLWMRAPDWGRGLLLGNTRVGEPVPLAVDPSGNVTLFLFNASEDRPRLQLMSFSPDGLVRWEHNFGEIELYLPDEPHILWDGAHWTLFWINDGSLYGMKIDDRGQALGDPEMLSKEFQVQHIAAATNGRGQVAVWFSTPPGSGGLFALAGDAGFQPVDPEGSQPELIFDEAGDLHAAWLRRPTARGANPFIYGFYPGADLSRGHAEAVYAAQIYGTTVLDGPTLGIDKSHAYIFWSLTFFTGPEAGTSQAYYVHFPRASFAPVSRERLLSIPWSYNLTYEAAESANLNSGRRVPLGASFQGGGTYIIQIRPNVHAAEEQAVVFQARTEYLMRKVQSQVGALYLSGEQPTGYQQLSFTPGQSSTPFLASDAQGNLYLTWLEKGDLPGWAVYFASTAPGIRSQFSRMTADDVGRISADTLFGLATGALLIPVAIAWILPSTIALALVNRILAALRWQQRGAQVLALTLGILALWALKLGFLPGMLTYAPFSAWMPFLPTQIYGPLRTGVPAAIALISLWIAFRYGSQPGELPTFRLFLAYALVDGVLTMAVYGVLIYAAF
ncbi:MAG TPA: hypothetical protein ENL35_07150 [Chloroflexi bacterium]|nr:hypothetical protein [Chloroflexota bacterium]